MTAIANESTTAHLCRNCGAPRYEHSSIAGLCQDDLGGVFSPVQATDECAEL
jgi:hypothetical protein